MIPIRFRLPFATPTLNEWERMHWRKRGKFAAMLSWEVRVAIGRQPLPTNPLPHAKVSITRFSAGMPDFDGMVGGCKKLLDVLQPPGPPYKVMRGNAWCGKYAQKYPYGLSIIADDSPSCCQTEFLSVRVARGGKAATEVIVEELA